jgi:exonuclease III
VGNFNIPISIIDRTLKIKINKDTVELNNTMYEMDLADIYRAYHPTAADYTFFSVAHGTLTKIDYILGHKANLNKHKKIKIILCT